MSTLVFLEHHGSTIQRGALGVLAKASELDPDTAGVVIGAGVDEAAASAGKYGAKKVYVADDPALEAPLPQPRVDVIAQLVEDRGIDTVLFGASVLASDVAAGLASRLDAGLNWDLNDLESGADGLVGKQPALQDSVIVDSVWTSPVKIGLVRSGSFDPRENGGGAETEAISAPIRDFSSKATMVSQDAEESSGPSIDEADILVTGGRGLGSPDNFSILEDLAGALGGAVASTRAVVDSGWYPYPTQIGQTGKVVSPKLYIGAGVSGAIQHKVGMQSSLTIVGINKDPNAPLFEFSDLAVVGDLNTIVPKLTELVKERRG